MENPRIGLALSGGGSRAIAFHLGCLRALHDLGILRNVQTLSTVSGGSVVGTLYAATDAKARIVFLRWQNPLPGSCAFTRYAAADPRINLVGVLEQAHGPLPTDLGQQNALWYKLYKSAEILALFAQDTVRPFDVAA